MAHKVKTFRKRPNGSYKLDIEDVNGNVTEFEWGPVPVDENGKPEMTQAKYEAMQLREAKLLVELAEAQAAAEASTTQGKKLAAEGTEI